MSARTQWLSCAPSRRALLVKGFQSLRGDDGRGGARVSRAARAAGSGGSQEGEKGQLRSGAARRHAPARALRCAALGLEHLPQLHRGHQRRRDLLLPHGQRRGQQPLQLALQRALLAALFGRRRGLGGRRGGAAAEGARVVRCGSRGAAVAGARARSAAQ
jgi:hypothetical protein